MFDTLIGLPSDAQGARPKPLLPRALFLAKIRPTCGFLGAATAQQCGAAGQELQRSIIPVCVQQGRANCRRSAPDKRQRRYDRRHPEHEQCRRDHAGYRFDDRMRRRVEVRQRRRLRRNEGVVSVRHRSRVDDYGLFLCKGAVYQNTTRRKSSGASRYRCADDAQPRLDTSGVW
jgi:hypothetical protein